MIVIDSYFHRSIQINWAHQGLITSADGNENTQEGKIIRMRMRTTMMMKNMIPEPGDEPERCMKLSNVNKFFFDINLKKGNLMLTTINIMNTSLIIFVYVEDPAKDLIGIFQRFFVYCYLASARAPIKLYVTMNITIYVGFCLEPR